MTIGPDPYRELATIEDGLARLDARIADIGLQARELMRHLAELELRAIALRAAPEQDDLQQPNLSPTG